MSARTAFAVICLVSGACVATAGEFDQQMASARKGDYTAQRNVAWMLGKGDGVAANPIEACAWRILVVSTQQGNVTDSDITMLDSACSTPQLVEFGQQYVVKLLKSGVPAAIRRIDRDISALTEERCPGSKCLGGDKALAEAYGAGARGGLDAARRLAKCLAEHCEPEMPGNLFQACVWSKVVAILTGGKLTREDRAIDYRSCEFLNSAAGVRVARSHAEQILKAASR